MKFQFFALFLLFLLNVLTVTGQNQNYINGRTNLCVGECEIYTPWIGNNNIAAIEYINISYLNQPDSTCSRLQYDEKNQNFTACFFCPGYYKIEGLFFGQNGQIYLDSLQIQVGNISSINIIPADSIQCGNSPENECENVCSGSIRKYRADNTDGWPVTWSVTGASSFTVTDNILTVVWGNGTFGQITATQNLNSFCSSEDTYCLNIKEDLKPIFTLPKKEICANESITLIPDYLSASIYNWDFGNGEKSADIKPVIAYDEPGTYTITLEVIDACGCKGSYTHEIKVKELFLPKIDCKSTICENTPVTYHTEADCGSFFWKVIGDGKITAGGGLSDKFISIDWGNGPLGIIELEVSGCNFDLCPQKATFDIPIISEDALISGKSIVCQNAKEVYSIQKFGATDYNWIITGGNITAGQGSNTIIVDWSGNTSGAIAVTYNNCYLKCGGSSTLSVNVKPHFTLSTEENYVCPQDLATFQAININNIPVILEKWEIKDKLGNLLLSEANKANIAYLIPGNLDNILVSGSSQAYCNSPQNIIINILSKTKIPEGIKGEKNICKNLDYLYNADSDLKSALYTWKIKDGSSEYILTGKDIILQWKSDGPYVLELVQLDLSGNFCTSNAITLLLNKVTNVVLSTKPEGCLYDTQIIRATPFKEMKYDWSIAPIDAATIINHEANELEILWSKTGKHTISLNTCAGNFQVDIEVLALPEPMVNHPAVLCENQLTSLSTTLGYNSYQWKDASGLNISTSANPSVLAGTYIAEVIDSKGCTGKKSFTIDLLPKPNIHLSTPDETGVCISSGSPFFPLLYALDAKDGYTYQWYQDGNVTSATSNTFLPTAIGKFTVEITDALGCKNISNTVTVYDLCDVNNPPVLDTFGTIKPCLTPGLINILTTSLDCNSIGFINTGTGQTGNDDIWYFDDNGPTDYSVPNQPVHHFSNAGFYKTGLISGFNDVNNPGQLCYKWTRKVIEIPVKAAFDFNNGCEGESIQFYDRSTFIPGKDIVSWSWDFGDPTSGSANISTASDPIHIYNADGQYTVTLTVSNGTCTDVVTQVITLHKKPFTTFTFPDGVCEKESTRVYPDSINVSFFKIDWEFGDVGSGSNNIQNGLTAYHTYENSGNYLIKTQIESIYGCKNTLTTSVNIVKNTLSGQISSSEGTTICEGVTSELVTSAVGEIWNWTTEETTSSIKVTKAGIYGVSITDVFGCTFEPNPLSIYVNPAPLAFIGAKVYEDQDESISFVSPTSFCVGKDLQLFTSLNNNFDYQWSNGLQSNQIEYSNKLNNQLSVGNFQFTLQTTDRTTGCKSISPFFDVLVNGFAGGVNIAATSSGVLCEGIQHQLKILNPATGISYLWNNNKKTTEINVKKAGSYFVTAKDGNGCTIKSNAIDILSGPDTDFVPSGCFERCGSDTLCFPFIEGVASYQWFKGGETIGSSDGGDQPYIILTKSETYVLKMTGTNGCVSTSDPLTLDIKPRVGVIIGNIYSDVNANNIIDSQDTLLADIKVGIPGSTTLSDQNGQFVFSNVPEGTYFPTIDKSKLIAGSKAIIDSLLTQIKICDDTIHLDYLVGFNCFAKTDKINFKVCFGQKIEVNGTVFSKDTIFNILKLNTAGCVDTSRYTINFTKEIQITTTAIASCPGAADGRIIIQAPDQKNYIFTLVNYPGIINNNEFNNLKADTYQLKVKDEFGCMIEKEIVLAEKPKLQVTLEQTNISCNSGSATLNIGSSNYEMDKLNITWSNGLTGDSIQVSKPGPYTMTVYNGCETIEKTANVLGYSYNHQYKKFIVCSGKSFELLGKKYSKDTLLYTTLVNTEGCVDTTTYDLRFGQMFANTLSINGHCPGKNNGEIKISTDDITGQTYLLNGNMVTTTNGNISNLAAGKYVLQIRDQLGCEQKFDVDINEKESVVYKILAEDISCFKGYAVVKIELQNYDEADVSIVWNNGSVGTTTNVTSAGIIKVDIANGCESINESITIKNNDFEPTFKLPHLFNPPLDGLETFVNLRLADLENSEVNDFYIFDRMGRKMFKSKNLIWNHTAQLPDGMYYYTIGFTIDICGQQKQLLRSGTFTIIR